MSFISRRALSTLIPPKVASPTAIGAAQDAARMSRIVDFYGKLPRGPAPEVKAKGLVGRYQARYFGKKASAMPIVHVIAALLAIGYAQNYYFHLRIHSPSAACRRNHIALEWFRRALMEKFSDAEFDGADPKIVMAELSAQDVVNQARSDRDSSPSDVIASQTKHSQVSGEEERATSPDSQPNVTSTSPPHVNGVDGEFVGDVGKNSSVRPLRDLYLYVVADSMQCVRGNGELPSSEPSHADGRTEVRQMQTNGGDYLSGPTTSADVSGGSDSDTTKPDGENLGGKKSTGEKGHNRSQSVKKPGSFKAVSVTKNFLAKTTTGTIPSSKLSGDKIVPATGQTSVSAQVAAPRPRLVAKTVNGMRDVAPRSGSNGSGSGRGSGPDPNQVWNKNRPVQPPPPKQFTDEELKQTYGIHLATRLQSDEASKEAKWADIDDDDDDWAPDTIEWNDGTKITLPQHEEQAMLSEEETPASASQEKPANEVGLAPSQVDSGLASTTTITGKNNASSTNQPKSGGLVLKGAAEKPTLVSKPQGPPTPVKSPWAPLPPVDKVGPAAIGLQQSQASQAQGGSRFQRDHQGFDSAAAAPQAKEIAADDFNRSWRDNQSASNRELFNSHSGRYEPVGEGRRGSARFDQNFRQPSLLQRPAVHDQQGPAEPSAAFQTNRASGHQESTWGRRRASSTVSGGSGGFARRMSFSKGQDIPPPNLHDTNQAGRRGSNTGANTESPASPRNFSPSRPSHHTRASPAQAHYPQRGYSPVQPSHHQQWQSRASPVVDHAHIVAPYTTGMSHGGPHSQQQQYAAPGKHQDPSMPLGNEVEDPLVLQAKIMQESRELAKRRKKEQQEKEEAELKERIKLKLEELGVPPVAEKGDTKPTNEGASKDNKQSSHSQSHPKPFVSESSSEVRQYGLMKVHPTEPFKKPMQLNQIPTNKELERQPLGPQAASPTKTSNIGGTGSQDTRLGNGNVTTPQEPALQGSPQPSPPDRKDQPWKHVPAGNDKYTSWGGAGMTTHSTPGGNLWGPPSNDKALGNGTFERGFGRFPPRSSAQQQFPPPGPIGPPGGSLRSTSGDSAPQYAGATPSNIREESRPTGGMSPPGSRPAKLANPPSATPGPKTANGPGPIGRPGPIAPPSGPSGMSRQNRTQAISAWNNLPTQLAQQDAEAREKRTKEYARLDEEAKLGIKQEEPPRVTYKDTWRQVSEGPPGARHVISVSTVVAEPVPLPTNQDELQRNRQMAAATAPEAVSNAGHPNALGNNRGSRFFPPVSDTALGRPASHSSEYSSPPSPPPPIAHDHPAYDGDVERPQVTLPPMSEETPKIIVKLPPPAVAPPALVGPVPRKEPARLSPRISDRSTAADWQARIAELVGSKQPLPAAKASDLAINSATKAPLELPSAQTSATVSLPRSEDGDLGFETARTFFEDNGDVTSRATEEALLEEREFGSLPVVRLPLRAPPSVWPPALAPPIARHKSRFQKPVQVASKEPLSFNAKDYQLKQGYFIPLRLPGFSEMKPVLKVRQEGPPQTGSPHSPQRSPSYNKRKHNKPSRESSGNFGSSRTASLGMQPGQQRPGFHSGTWSRRVSEAVQ
ncbi:MAG: hypothetical protein M1839_005850 [Geoglossum umbratile]|nr:MAG: hypothetical protein M1839_005850 [Geoglossum umbratile]